jgi:hypothetical protein
VIVAVDLASGAVTLESADDCGRFHVVARGDGGIERLDAALRDSNVGRVDGDGAFIAVDAVRRLAATGHVGDAWDSDFAAMVDYARTKGWLDDAGAAIRAHIEWA